MNILAIGAHPDDIELGCGGLLLKAARLGHDVFMYTLTRGSASGDPKERTKEQIESARVIRAKKCWVDNFEDSKLSLTVDLINHIETVVRISKPSVVYTHSTGDTHHDHRAIAQATLEAARFVPNILSYEMPVTKDFKPHIYYDISDVMEDKISLLGVFRSQQNKMFITSKAVKGLAQYRALQSRLSNVDCVESFEVMKLSLNASFNLVSPVEEAESLVMEPLVKTIQLPKEIDVFHP
jgi:LmbE family N-acetylglucosaminyl deacetylase